MTKERFVNLIAALCKLLNLDAADHIVHGGPVRINDVLFSFAYNDKEAPEYCLAYCDFGKVSLGNEAEAYQMLLEANLLMHTGKGLVFTVNPMTEHVVCAAHYPLEGTSAESLRDRLATLAAHAKTWHQQYSSDADFNDDAFDDDATALGMPDATSFI